MRHLCQVNPDTMEFEIMTGLEFLTIIVLAFAVVMVLAGLFTTGFGYGKSRVAGVIMLIMGIAVGIIWALLAGNGDLVERILEWIRQPCRYPYRCTRRCRNIPCSDIEELNKARMGLIFPSFSI